jgi:hypothetical protein
MVFYLAAATLAFGIPVAAALLFVWRPRLGSRIMAGWVGLLGALTLLVIGTTLTALGQPGPVVRAALAAVLALALFGALTAGLWRERRWAIPVLTGLIAAAALLNVVSALREHAKLEPATLVSYVTVLPALLFMTYRVLRAGDAVPHTTV